MTWTIHFIDGPCNGKFTKYPALPPEVIPVTVRTTIDRDQGADRQVFTTEENYVLANQDADNLYYRPEGAMRLLRLQRLWEEQRS